MKSWEVTLPIAGVAHLVVEAETEEDAINEALNTCSTEHLSEWESYRRISSGNVLHVQHNEAYAEEIDTE